MVIVRSSERYKVLKQMLEERQKIASSPFAAPQEIPELEAARADELERVAKALRALEDGTYGICRGCHQEIGEGRLMALPYIKICTDCDVQAEIEYLRRDQQKRHEAEGPLFAQG